MDNEDSRHFLEFIDRQKIQELIYKYASTYDHGDLEGWFDLFTDDCTWTLEVPTRDTPLLKVNSRAELKAHFSRVYAEVIEPRKESPGFAGFHFFGGTVFDEITESTAKTRTTATAILQSFLDDGSKIDEKDWHQKMEAGVPFAGVYHDVLRKVDGQWKFVKKVFRAGMGAPVT